MSLMSNETVQATRMIRDSNWVRKSFLLSANKSDEESSLWRTWSTAYSKYVDTSLGGNFAINQLPQFTRYADLRTKGLSRDALRAKGQTSASMSGMGRYYSEAIDDTSQLIHMRYGTARFNSLISFFVNFYDHEAGVLAREGRVPFSFYAGKIATTIVTLPLQVVFALFSGVNTAINFFTGRPRSKFYYMVPAMAMYWNRVNFMCNSIATNMGLVMRSFDTEAAAKGNDLKMTEEVTESADYKKFGWENYGDVWKEHGQVDMYQVANRAKRKENVQRKEIEKILGDADKTNISKRLRQFYLNGTVTDPGGKSTREYLEAHHTSILGNLANMMVDAIGEALNKSNADGAATTTEAAPAEGATETPAAPASANLASSDTKGDLYTKVSRDTDDNTAIIPGIIANYFKPVDSFEADWAEGSQFVTFRVDSQGPVSESFSNSFQQSQIQQRMNQVSSTASELRFSAANGNLGIPGVDQLIQLATNVVTGGLDAVGFDGLLALAGQALVDIPQSWESASSQFPSSNYTIELRAWSGNKICIFSQLIVPVVMLLAAALPMSTGLQSYTSPFLCELFSQGRNQIRLGMIKDLTISRGEGNVGWTRNHQPLGININFSVQDMSTLMHAPIDVGFKPLNPLKGIFDEDNAFNDYMSVLGAASMADMIYPSRKFANRWTQKKLNFSSYWSMSRMSNNVANNRTVQAIASIFTPASSRTFM